MLPGRPPPDQPSEGPGEEGLPAHFTGGTAEATQPIQVARLHEEGLTLGPSWFCCQPGCQPGLGPGG